MRKYRFKQVQNYIVLFRKITEAITLALGSKQPDIAAANNYLQTCQQKAIELGEYIEGEEGLGHPTVSVLEEFCELIYNINEDILSEHGLSAESAKNRLETCINKIERSANGDIEIQRLAVFLPYKASMWDSLESVWMAANDDPKCKAVVIPIPYFDRNPDGSVKAEYWEGDQFPDYVPITKFDEFDFGAEHPDMIFIHNPYDGCNLVTSVHPFFYSDKLKQFTDCLVYIPYFATSGNMSEGQALLPAYMNVDYIVIQSEKFKGFYDASVPREKFLPFGSPKFDSVIRRCKNPPEPPEEWKAKMEGKTVYFYNTSLNGMLANTESFMKKMVYVFDTFRDRKDACLLWRPHPLFEKTLANMRGPYLPIYEDIRDKYIAEDWGIYDTTPGIEMAVALSDVYIGDAATSVTSLFGVAGKPLFILNNGIHELPPDDLWKYMGGVPAFQLYDGTWHKKYALMGNKLFARVGDSQKYEFKQQFDFLSGSGLYGLPYDYKENKIYIFPVNAQDILVVEGPKVRHIPLERKIERPCAFFGPSFVDNLAIIWPHRYPDLVVFDMDTEQVMYLNDFAAFNVTMMEDGERVAAARLYYKHHFYMLSADGTKVMIFNLKTMKIDVKNTGFSGLFVGAAARRIDDSIVYLIPLVGTKVIRFNYDTFESREYDINVEGLEALDRNLRIVTEKKIFSSAIVLDDKVIFSPRWGNKFVELNPETGEAKEWDSPFDAGIEDLNNYVKNVEIGCFGQDVLKDEYTYWYSPKRQWYRIDPYTKEIEPFAYCEFDKDFFYQFEEGYHPISEWMKYCCCEGAFNTLKDLLDGNIHGAQHDKLKQLEDYADINSSTEGDCGEKVYGYLI